MAFHSLRIYRIVPVLGTILLLGAGLLQTACGNLKKVEGKGADSPPTADASRGCSETGRLRTCE